MKVFLLILLCLFVNCSLNDPLSGSITWDEVVSTTWYMDEPLNDLQICRLSFTFACDTLYLLKTYYDSETKKIEEYRYMKGRVFNKRYVKDSEGDIDLFFTWARKHYADPEYTTPVEGYDIVDDWFLYKIDQQNHLLMGLVTPPNICQYWTLERRD